MAGMGRMGDTKPKVWEEVVKVDIFNTDKKYNIIYADPPWKYRVYSSKGNGRSAASHYNVMDLEDIKKIPVSKISSDNCVLFLWATFPNLKEAFEVLESWRFTKKLLRLYGLNKIVNLTAYFGEWDIGQGQMQKYVSWQKKAPQNGNQPGYIK